MPERVRSSRSVEAWKAVTAAGSFVSASASKISSCGCESTQRTTSAIVSSVTAAANRSGPSSFAAAAYQNSALSSPALLGCAAAASQEATRCAPSHVPHPASGVHPAAG